MDYIYVYSIISEQTKNPSQPRKNIHLTPATNRCTANTSKHPLVKIHVPYVWKVSIYTIQTQTERSGFTWETAVVLLWEISDD